MSATPFLFFDGDGTLWDFEGVLRHALGIVLGEIRRLRPSPVSDALSVETLTADRNAVAAERRGSRTTLAEIRRAGLDRTLARCGAPDPDLAAHLYTLFMRHRFDDIEVYPDVPPSTPSRRRIGWVSSPTATPIRSAADSAGASRWSSSPRTTASPSRTAGSTTWPRGRWPLRAGRRPGQPSRW
ncbi:hypothetical protein HEB94_004694 [Actinopolymorpha pittospori]|uniref:Haloacid dehalogenase-like hydrolase n=1 Tax=Actinopolymorpha pittospori TaxID=648752 RepID=A0A927RK35_9ACTN|nr:hypothetical protein [Actinopolymorpha pittospori]MBE1607846.1 hypothetical protein [Actinopolymorpha pittospori]